jgi:hypothetical protein
METAGWRKASLVLATLVCTCSTALSQTMPDSNLPTFTATSQLVLVDVIPEYTKTELHKRTLLTDLKREDFRIFDNGKEMPIRSFDVGATHETRPIAL